MSLRRVGSYNTAGMGPTTNGHPFRLPPLDGFGVSFKIQCHVRSACVVSTEDMDPWLQRMVAHVFSRSSFSTTSHFRASRLTPVINLLQREADRK